MDNLKKIALLCNYELLPERVGGMDYFFGSLMPVTGELSRLVFSNKSTVTITNSLFMQGGIKVVSLVLKARGRLTILSRIL
jgi:hypothetical protein